MSLLEQDHQEGVGVQKRYEMYKNVATLLRYIQEHCYVQELDRARVEDNIQERYKIYKNIATLLHYVQKYCYVRERYEMYKNTATYKNVTQLEYKIIYENVTRCT